MDHATHPARRESPAATRNTPAIREVLRARHGDRTGTLLEIGSGTGQHAAGLSSTLSGITWYPTDLDEANLGSIDAWAKHEGASTVQPAQRLDVLELPWALDPSPAPCALVYCANVVHISPVAVVAALFDGASRVLAADGALLLYGPFRIGGEHTAPSNARFDAQLRERDPSWGIRDLEALDAAAETRSLVRSARVTMPANNFILEYVRR